MSRWRTGTRNPHTLYLDDKPAGFFLEPALAQLVVERLNCFPCVEMPRTARSEADGLPSCATRGHSFSQRNGYGPCWCGEPPVKMKP